MILHGGNVDLVNLKLKRLGLPPVQGEDPLPNPFPQLRVVWSPLAGSSVQAAGNAASNYYPGNSYVDVVGGDIYGENFTAPLGRASTRSTAWRGSTASRSRSRRRA